MILRKFAQFDGSHSVIFSEPPHKKHKGCVHLCFSGHVKPACSHPSNPPMSVLQFSASQVSSVVLCQSSQFCSSLPVRSVLTSAVLPPTPLVMSMMVVVTFPFWVVRVDILARSIQLHFIYVSLLSNTILLTRCGQFGFSLVRSVSIPSSSAGLVWAGLSSSWCWAPALLPCCWGLGWLGCPQVTPQPSLEQPS